MKKAIKNKWANYDGRKEHIDYPDKSIFELLNDSAHYHMESISYNYYGTKRTYRQFLKQIDECARALKHLKVKESDVITVCLPNIPEAMIAFYAINKIGAISNMLSPSLDTDTLIELINSSNSKYLITLDLIMPRISNITSKTKIKKCIIASIKDSLPLNLHISYSIKTKKIVTFKRYKDSIRWSTFIKHGRKYKRDYNYHFSKDELATIIYTKGTVDKPKGVLLSNLNINSYALESVEAFRCFSGKDTLLCTTPLYSGMGIAFCLHTIQYTGGITILNIDQSLKTYKKAITNYRPNIIIGTPDKYVEFIKKYHMDDIDLSFIKCVINTDDNLPLSLKKSIDVFFSDHGVHSQIRDLYGLTECVSGTAVTPINYYREGSIGTPYSDTYYKIVIPGTFKEAKVGKEGEIIISGPTVMQGYINDIDKTNKVLKEDKLGKVWLFTGDIGFMDPDGFIYFKDRID